METGVTLPSTSRHPLSLRAPFRFLRRRLVIAAILSGISIAFIAHKDFAGASFLVSADAQRCSLIAHNSPVAKQHVNYGACVAGAANRQTYYWRLAYTHTASMLLAIVFAPGLSVFLVNGLRRLSLRRRSRLG